MNKKKWIGMGIGFAGFIPVLSLQKGSEELLSSLGFISWPELAIIGASIASVYGWVLLRLLVKDNAVSIPVANGMSMFFGGAIALVHSLCIDTWNPLPVASADLPAFAQGLAILISISNIICYNLYGLMLKRFTATFLSFMGLLYPIFASINGWIFLGEPISPTILISTGIVSIGLWLIHSAELKQGYIQSPVKSNAQNT